ncbi:Pantetheinase [Araneus ventricosus]|uniref:Pantetheinase n=1 Tax=Araneus ventricosus TaxID=182803 RepID=A0A4Y2N6U2_ARAVE|nr:Pantetheinase [Araneus ventricosus]
MLKNGIKAICISVFLLVSFNGSRGQKDYYTAGVFEIFQFQDSSYSGSEIIKKNLEKYAVAAGVASSHQVDIMVYPEEGLFPVVESVTSIQDVAEDVPDPRTEETIPCDEQDEFQNSPILRNLSCLAKEHKFYVVADLIDMKKCEVQSECNEYNADYCRTSEQECPENDLFFFNTLVAFNRQGTLIARYYKRHLYFEEGISTPRIPKNVYFETDFGKFTGDICFDLFFIEAVEGADRPDVTALSYPTWWYDHTPLMYFATPYQQAWSMTNKVNILAANVHYPRDGSLGSGIYSAVKGALVYTHNPDGRSKLLISNVPISATQIPKDISFDTKFYYIDDDKVTELQGEEPRDFSSECGFNVLGNASSSLIDYRCHQTEVHQYTFIKLNETKGDINICSNKFCCSLNYEAQSMDETFYFGVSGNRLNFYDTYLLGIQACFLARCEPLNGEPCRNFLLKSNTIFETVDIVGSFDTENIYPFVINSEIRLADKDEWNFDGKSHLKYMNLNRKPLLFIGLNGRLYNRDKKLTGSNSKSNAILTRKISLSVFLLPVLCYISLKLQEKFCKEMV